MQRAKEIVWTGRWQTGPEAVDCGLALRSVPRSALRAEAIGASMTSKPDPCIAANKSVFQQSVDQTIGQSIENEIRCSCAS